MARRTDCDIGKLANMQWPPAAGLISVQRFGREQIYTTFRLMSQIKIQSASPRTRQCESNCFRQFQPTQMKKYPCMDPLTAHMLMVYIFCHACRLVSFLHLKRSWAVSR